ncbi:hypothetical protein JYU34_007993 [Plutella xylostella]|uniref:Leishmanolysin-like peptidase n=1 Tax=Plutella xylostella TaxID=51655 RepID=A0ABQ7QNK4_PLUXY|nr:hypothetical protein JYU34_007993 [Plutella xylostella]
MQIFQITTKNTWYFGPRRDRNPAPYCKRIKGDPLRTECSPARDAVVLCNLVKHDVVLPKIYQTRVRIPALTCTIKGDPLRTECSPARDAVVLCNLVKHDVVLPKIYQGDPLRTECSPARDAVVLCNLVKHDVVLPKIYQHFDSLDGVPPSELGHYGGSVSLADYCPYLQQFTWRHKSVLVRGSRCEHRQNTPKADVNFALESYGEHSRCFDHHNHMWEQKSCRQIREWQHWGSGCYKYKCKKGRLHIIVGNYTYECSHAGQVLHVRVLSGGWLHRGGVVCPPCREICAAEFASRNEYCKGGEEPKPPNLYPNDILTCSAGGVTPAAILVSSAILFYSVATLW